MPRFARIVIPGCPHHVTQRGNHRRTVFYADADHRLYFSLQRNYFIRWQIQCVGYALMTNHTHHALVPGRTDSFARGIGGLTKDFARWQHIQQNLTGHLWQDRFFSCPLDEDHFWKALRYIELNPVRAGLVRYAWDWPWSSALAHVTGIDPTGLLNMEIWSKRFDGERWKAFLEEGLEDKRTNDILRLATRTGRPLGSKEFVDRLEAMIGRKLRPQKPGPKLGSVRVKP
jgi:putative transposase